MEEEGLGSREPDAAPVANPHADGRGRPRYRHAHRVPRPTNPVEAARARMEQERMMAPVQKFAWFLWPTYGELSGASDEFVAEGFRVRLMGNTLELSFEGSGAYSPESAKVLAEKYIAVLRKFGVSHLLITQEEFLARTAPPFGVMTVRSGSREDRDRVTRATREARSELLASADPALRRCYNYLQSARKNDHGTIFDLYKTIETIENALGGEERAGRILGVVEEIKALKRAANERAGDERHAPKDPASTPSPADLGQAWENTKAVVRAYEAYLCRERQLS